MTKMTETPEPKEKKVREIDPDWIIGLMEKGLIVRLNISRWTGTAKLTPEELGLKFVDDDSSKFNKDYISLGSQKLLPPDILSQFKKLEQKSRVLLKSMSFDTVWGRFVPETSLLEWERLNEEIKKEYMEAAKNFGNRYNDIVKVVKADYRNLAKDVWARLYPENKDDMTDSFEEHFVQTIVDKIPNREKIVSMFGYKHIYFEIPVPSVIHKDIEKSNDTIRSDEAKQAEHVAVLNSRQRLLDIYVERRKEYMDDFLDSTVKTLRRNIANLCEAVLSGIGDRRALKKDLTRTHVKRIKDIINNVKNLNFYDDKEIADLISDLDTEVDKVKGERSGDIISDRLEKIVEIAKEEFVIKDFNPTVENLEI